MELRHLRYFLTVAKELNFTKASEILFISQPPLSRQIKELEIELGVQLFDRNNKRVLLTEAGKYFEKEVIELLNTLEAVNIQTKKISENLSGEYRIAYISSTFSKTISDLVQHLSEIFPYLKIKLYEVSSIKQIAALEQNKLDLGILRAPLTSTKIGSKFWFKDYYSIIYNKNTLKVKSNKDIEKLRNETFVFFNKDYAPAYHNALLEICAKYGFAPNIVHESNNINSIIQLVRNGLGVSIVPSSLSKSYSFPELDFFELNKSSFTNVMMAWQKNRSSDITDSAISYLLN